MVDRRAVSWPDLALTAVLLLVGLNGTGPAAANQGETVPLAGYVLVVAACLPIVVWRWWPVWALVGSGAATAIYLGLGYAYGPIMFPLVVAVYGYAARTAIRRTVIATAVLVSVAVAALAVEVVAADRDGGQFLTGLAWVSAWIIIPAAVGTVVKVRRDATAEVRAEQARRGASEERLRLAQEVHDVVGHSLAVIAMQAGVALRAMDHDSDRTRSAVQSIRSVSTEALESLRAELDALRHTHPASDAPRRPRTGLGDLPALVDRFRDSCLPVSVEQAGGFGDLPADVDHAAYRVIQEALTNVLRHGGPRAVARTRVIRDASAVVVEVTNSRTDPAPEDDGHGIRGMQERARALGGTLDAGQQPGGGFTVRAWLPLPAEQGSGA